ncbi:TetR/AcrR family transcriptional regulator [Acidimicrobiales bacterium]|jgi:AcrR family transcriptional regulator|nr:TetR/AcrR family transcriptional regulator [bacterium]MDB9846326.1 TetR/AcrR family transcriptional regulator [Acidimicrobiales bacterium]MDC3300046.1 TetR/AcrR family transcriptional regulator [Acidimicrobiales bacterium]
MNETASLRPDDDEIRAALIDAAAQVFAEEGYSGARVQSIAERAGLTTGAMYNRFTGKSELLLEALDLHTSTLVNELAAAELSATDLLQTVGVALLDDQSPASALLLEAFMAARREDDIAERLRPRLADERARLAKLVDADKDGGVIHHDLDTNAVVTFCQSVALGMRMLSVIDVEMPDPDAWQKVISVLLTSMAPDGGPAKEKL